MFKVGDKVERIRPSGIEGMKKGNIYTVKRVNMDGEIELEGWIGSWRGEYFKLVKERNEI